MKGASVSRKFEVSPIPMSQLRRTLLTAPILRSYVSIFGRPCGTDAKSYRAIWELCPTLRLERRGTRNTCRGAHDRCAIAQPRAPVLAGNNATKRTGKCPIKLLRVCRAEDAATEVGSARLLREICRHLLSHTQKHTAPLSNIHPVVYPQEELPQTIEDTDTVCYGNALRRHVGLIGRGTGAAGGRCERHAS